MSDETCLAVGYYGVESLLENLSRGGGRSNRSITRAHRLVLWWWRSALLAESERKLAERKEKHDQQAALNVAMVEQNCLLIRRNTALGDGALAESERKLAEVTSDRDALSRAIGDRARAWGAERRENQRRLEESERKVARLEPRAEAYDNIAIGLGRTEDEIRRVVYFVCTMPEKLRAAEDKVARLERRNDRWADAANSLLNNLVNEGEPGADVDAAFCRLQRLVHGHWPDDAPLQMQHAHRQQHSPGDDEREAEHAEDP